MPWFVAAKDATRNVLIVVQGHDHPLLYRRDVDAQQMHWIAGTAPAATLLARLRAKTRYRMPDAPCRVELQPADRGARRHSPSRSGRRRRGSTSCSTTVTCAWAAA